MVAGPAVCPAVGSGYYDDVIMIGGGCRIVPDIEDMSIALGKTVIRPKAYWRLSFIQLVNSVLSMIAKTDLATWGESTVGAGDTTMTGSLTDENSGDGSEDEEDSDYVA